MSNDDVRKLQQLLAKGPGNGWMSASNARAVLCHWGHAIPEWLKLLPAGQTVMFVDGEFQKP